MRTVSYTHLLNILIYNLSKKQHIQLIIICFVLWSAIPTLIGFIRNNTEVDLMYTRFLWFVVLYIFSSFIKLHGFQSKIKTWILFIVSLIIQIGVTFPVSYTHLLYEECKSSGFLMMYSPQIFVTHLEHFSTKMSLNSEYQRLNFMNNNALESLKILKKKMF